jgi:hypothetical protein
MGISQIPVSELYGQPVKRPNVTLAADQYANLLTLLDQKAR